MNGIQKQLLIIFSAVLLTAYFAGCRDKNHFDAEAVRKCISAKRLSDKQLSAISKKINARQKAYSLDTLFSRKARYQGFNGAVLVAQQGVVLYEKAFGMADFGSQDSLTLQSAFQLASVSKTFTGTAVLLLAQDNLLKLTDTVQKFLPGFPYSGITIENLLSHRSGLPNYLYSFEDKRKAGNCMPNNDSIMKWFAQANPLPKPYGQPGKNFSYNNTNFVVLASIIEKVSQKPYAEFLKERIFDPLQMHHTFVDTIAPDSLLVRKTTGYHGGRARARDFYDGVYGDKGIFSTVGDLEKWYFGLRSGCLLSKHWLKLAFTPQSFERRSRHNYGLGFRLMTDPDNMHHVRYVYHGGWWAGYSTMLWMNMKSDIVVIVLGNKKNNSVYEIRPVLSILGENADENMDDTSDE